MTQTNTDNSDDAPATERPREDQPDRNSEGDIHKLHDPIMREKVRPRDGYQPIPLTLMFLFFALIGWGGWYLGAYSGDWRVDVLYPGDQPGKVQQQTEEPQQSATPASLKKDGEQVYARCASCHQNDGGGMGTSFPPLDGSEWVTGPPDVPIRIVLHGLEGPIKVKGTEYNQQMPAWGDRLDDRQIAAVLTYIRSAWSNDADAVMPEQVAKVRDATSDRASRWTADELSDLGVK